MAREVVHTLPYNWSKTVWVITFSFYIVAVVVIGLLIATIVKGGVVGGVIGLVVALPIFVAIAVYCTHFSILGNYGTTLAEVACPRVDKRCNLHAVAIDETVSVSSTQTGYAVAL